VDRELRAVIANDCHDLEQIGSARRPEVEAGVVALLVDRHRVGHGVLDVLVGDAVLARRRMDLEHES